jgi:hypothetical protein
MKRNTIKLNFIPKLCIDSVQYRLDIYEVILDYFQEKMNQKDNRSAWRKFTDFIFFRKFEKYYPDMHNTSFINIISKYYDNFPYINDEDTYIKYYLPELGESGIPFQNKLEFYNDIHRIRAVQAARDKAILELKSMNNQN